MALACSVALGASLPSTSQVGPTASASFIPQSPSIVPPRPSPTPLGFHPSTSSCSGPSVAGGSVPKGLGEPGLAAAVCPAQTTFERYFHHGHKLYLRGRGGKPQKNTTRKESMFYTKKKKKAIFLASHFLSSLCYYCRYVFE